MLPETPSREQVMRFISAVDRRRLLLHVAGAVALAGLVGLVFALVASFTVAPRASSFRIPASLLIGAVAVAYTGRHRSRRITAASIESSVPACRNLIVTAEELERHPTRASSGITTRVYTAAHAALLGVRAGDVVPSYRVVALAALGVAASFLAAPAGQRAVQQLATRAADALPAPAAPDVRVRIEPPAYSGRPATTLESPTRIEVLEGSRITFDVRAEARVRFGNEPVGGPMVARESGYFAVESEASTLIPLSVLRDRVPTVRIEAPGKDLLLVAGDRSIPVTIQAIDDLALERVELRYTRVSGSGEQFEFEEGTLPVRLERTSAREWRASGELALARLRLEPGDSLVYRAVARDARPGTTGTAASDTYFVEIAGPGQVALEGVDMPTELERYAMSQQMIVLKLERLKPRARGMPREALVEEASGIAAEQRTVRANFIFLLGGHVEDEEVEAEHSHEIQEGRLENTARKDINTAISHMTRVAQGLTAVDVDAALPPARAAVEALQRAFGKSRYLLRSLAVRSRLDPSRRLTGNMAGADNWTRTRPEQEEHEGEAARQLLERLVETAGATSSGQVPAPRVIQSLAEAALSIDSASPLWQSVAAGLVKAQDRAAIDAIIAQIGPEARRGALPRTGLAFPPSGVGRAFELERRQR